MNAPIAMDIAITPNNPNPIPQAIDVVVNT
jgi:hypothetical protein